MISKVLDRYAMLIVLFATTTISLATALKDATKIDEFLTLHYVFFQKVTGFDHQSFEFEPYYFWSKLFGTSDFSLRCVGVILFIIAIFLFYRWCARTTSSFIFPLLGSLILITDSYIVEHNVYAYSSIFLFLLSLSSCMLFERILKENTFASKEGLLLIAINALGVNLHMCFYLVGVTQFFFLLVKRFDHKGKYLFLFLLPLLIHSFVFIPNLMLFRFALIENEGNMVSLYYFYRCMMGFVRGAYPAELTANIVVTLILIKTTAISVLFLLKLRISKSWNDFDCYLLFLAIVCVLAYVMAKSLNLKEIEYRYFYFMVPLLIRSILGASIVRAKWVSVLSCLVILSVNIFSLSSYLKTKIHGDNDDILEQIFVLNETFRNETIFTDKMYYLETMIRPLFVRKYGVKDFDFKYKKIEETSKQNLLLGKGFLVFRPDEFNIENYVNASFEKITYQFLCKSCDNDFKNMMLYYIREENDDDFSDFTSNLTL